MTALHDIAVVVYSNGNLVVQEPRRQNAEQKWHNDQGQRLRYEFLCILLKGFENRANAPLIGADKLNLDFDTRVDDRIYGAVKFIEREQRVSEGLSMKAFSRNIEIEKNLFATTIQSNIDCHLTPRVRCAPPLYFGLCWSILPAIQSRSQLVRCGVCSTVDEW